MQNVRRNGGRIFSGTKRSKFLRIQLSGFVNLVRLNKFIYYLMNGVCAETSAFNAKCSDRNLRPRTVAIELDLNSLQPSFL